MKTYRFFVVSLAIIIVSSSFILFTHNGNLQSNDFQIHNVEPYSLTTAANSHSRGEKASDSPTIRIDSPANGAIVKDSFNLVVTCYGYAIFIDIYVDYVFAQSIMLPKVPGKEGLSLIIPVNVKSWPKGWHTIGVQAKNNEGGFSQKPTISILVNDDPPTANAGADKTVLVNTNASFAGTGTDSDGTIKKYEWDFNGDGTYDWSSVTTGVTTYRYTKTGIYTAKLRVTDNYGVTATDTVTITVIQTPPIAYITTPSEGQIFDNSTYINFTGYGTDAEGNFLTNASITWSSNISGNIGTGNITTNSLSAGTHRINLTVQDSRGYTGSAIVNITVPPRTPPTVNVTFSGPVDNVTLVAEERVAFNARVFAYSGSGITYYEWDANGDSIYEYNSSITGDIGINFTSPGVTTISTRVTDGNGTQKVKQFTFTVIPNLGTQLNVIFTNSYNFTAGGNNFTITERRNFTINVSAFDKDGIGSISIDLYGDGSNVLTETDKAYYNASWRYASPGNYTLKVSVVDKVGVESNKTYTIYTIPNRLPNADFSLPVSWSANSPLQLFGNASDPDGNIIDYTWNFGDGNSSYEREPTYTWTTKGTFDINLTVTDDLGGMGFSKRTISITNCAPNAILAANTTYAQTYVPIMFYSNATDLDGYVSLHAFDFGDGNTTGISSTNGTSIEHNYTQKGTYNVTLKVYDNDGGFAVKKITVTILNTPPTLLLPSNMTALSLTSLKLEGTASDIDGIVVNYTWDFGDITSIDNVAYTPIPTAFYMYSVPGIFTVTLTIQDNDGGTTMKTVNVTITNRPPTCSFTASSDKKPGEEFTFNANATDSDGTILKYKWDFGDKNSTGWVDNSVIKHTYMHAGKYDATLTVVDNNGGESAVAFITVTVVNILPVADIVRPKYVYVDEETQFFGNGSYDTHGAIVSYRWDFDDGTTSVEINPKHTYKRIGSYNVSLTVTDDGGDTDTDNEAIEIIGQAKPPPGSGEMDITNYLDLYANLMGLLIALASVAGGYLVLRKKRSVLGRQMTLVDSSMKLQNPVERYRRLCNIQKASSKLLQHGKISENNYMILDNKIRDYKNVLEKKHPDIEKVAELPQSPYQQSEKDDVRLDSHGEYK